MSKDAGKVKKRIIEEINSMVDTSQTEGFIPLNPELMAKIRSKEKQDHLIVCECIKMRMRSMSDIDKAQSNRAFLKESTTGLKILFEPVQ